jgi:hypothetical protein
MSMGVIVVVMIVVAMFVVVMVLTMVVIVTTVVVVMTMIVIMRGMGMGFGMGMRGMCMRVGFRRMGVTARVRPPFGIERRFDLDDARAQPLHHRLDDVIAADAQAFRHDLGRQMTIAEMPGDPHQMQRIGAADFEQRFRGGDHLYQPPVFEDQRIAAAQRYRVFEIEQEFQPARPRHRHPPPVPVVEIEHDSVGTRLGPAMLAENCCCADHEGTLHLKPVASSFETALRASSG